MYLSRDGKLIRRNNSELYDRGLFIMGKHLFIACDPKGKIHYISYSVKQMIDALIKKNDIDLIRVVVIEGIYPLLANPNYLLQKEMLN